MSEKIVISRYDCYQEYKKLKESDPKVIGDLNTAEKILKNNGVFFKSKPESTDRNNRAYILQKCRLDKEMKTVIMQKKNKKTEAQITGIFFDSSKYADLTYVHKIAASATTGDLFQETGL
jgi:hypothetical protein